MSRRGKAFEMTDEEINDALVRAFVHGNGGPVGQGGRRRAQITPLRLLIRN